jgi:hypothetical protein
MSSSEFTGVSRSAAKHIRAWLKKYVRDIPGGAHEALVYGAYKTYLQESDDETLTTLAEVNNYESSIDLADFAQDFAVFCWNLGGKSILHAFAILDAEIGIERRDAIDM